MVSISIHSRAIKTPAVKLYRPLIYRRSVKLYRSLHVSHLVSSPLHVDGESLSRASLLVYRRRGRPGVRPFCQVGSDPLFGPRTTTSWQAMALVKLRPEEHFSATNGHDILPGFTGMFRTRLWPSRNSNASPHLRRTE
jgi:hypothetical protein